MNEEKLQTVVGGELMHFYLYFVLAAGVSLYLVWKSDTKDKLEWFVLAFLLMTGSINQLLTFKIPGFSFFEIQPERFLFFLFSFYLFRKIVFSKDRIQLPDKWPWFFISLMGYVLFWIVSQTYHVRTAGVEGVVLNLVQVLNLLFILFSVKHMTNPAGLKLLSKAVLFGAVVTSIISLIQLGEPMFMRYGDQRGAFGNVLRSNGIFSTEYFNAYFLIISIAWSLVFVKNNTIKTLLILLFSIGVISSFQRMSWLILLLVLFIYLVWIAKLSWAKLSLIGLGGIAVILAISLVFYQDIMNSSLVKERLNDSVEGRAGYYTMVIENIGDKPVFGFGGMNNEVYYKGMMKVTRSIERATGEEGDLHSGYFTTLFYYGIPAFICFLGFVIGVIIYFARLIPKDFFYIIPFLFAVIFAVSNLTNTIIFPKYLAFMFAIHIGLGWGARFLPSIWQEPSQQLPEDTIAKNPLTKKGITSYKFDTTRK